MALGVRAENYRKWIVRVALLALIMAGANLIYFFSYPILHRS